MSGQKVVCLGKMLWLFREISLREFTCEKAVLVMKLKVRLRVTLLASMIRTISPF